jgi:hypothetical protein
VTARVLRLLTLRSRAVDDERGEGAPVDLVRRRHR